MPIDNHPCDYMSFFATMNYDLVLEGNELRTVQLKVNQHLGELCPSIIGHYSSVVAHIHHFLHQLHLGG